MEPGETKQFSVAPEENIITRYRWIAEGFDGEDLWGSDIQLDSQSGGMQFELTAPDQADYNAIQVRCVVEKLVPYYICNDQFCGWTEYWYMPSVVRWKVRLSQDPPIWNGNYLIETQSDFEQLKDFKAVTGNLKIDGTSQYGTFRSLRGLEGIETVGGCLILENNLFLKTLDGINNLTDVGSISLWGNDALTNLEGLSSELTSLEGGLRIANNDRLTNLSALENITSIGGNLEIDRNIALANLSGLGNITYVGGDLYIGGNDALANLNGLNSQLTSIGGDLKIGSRLGGNAVLTS